VRLQRLKLFWKRDIFNEKKEQSNRFVRDEIIRVQTAMQASQVQSLNNLFVSDFRIFWNFFQISYTDAARRNPNCNKVDFNLLTAHLMFPSQRNSSLFQASMLPLFGERTK
jgi:hypothetical protein